MSIAESSPSRVNLVPVSMRSLETRSTFASEVTQNSEICSRVMSGPRELDSDNSGARPIVNFDARFRASILKQPARLIVLTLLVIARRWRVLRLRRIAGVVVILILRLRIALGAVDTPARRGITLIGHAAVGRIDVAVVDLDLRRDAAAGQQLRLRRQLDGLAGAVLR